MNSHEVGKIIETAIGIGLLLIPAHSVLEFIAEKGLGAILAADGITRE